MQMIQFGEGNFLRAFVEWIAQRSGLTVAVVKPRPGNSLERLKAQHCRYHVNLRGLQDGKTIDSIEEITCITAAVNPYEDYAAFLALTEVPEARFIVSNTTEAGIAFDPSCKFSDTPATSFPAKLTQLLYHRFRVFHGDPSKGFILLPCELIFHNGQQLKTCVLQYIELWKETLGNDEVPFLRWVEEACYFCTTLVDRIVPGYPNKDVEALQARLSQPDPLLVQAEPYHLWVIEVPDNLTTTQLSAELPVAGLNVVFTTDESPYHQRKVTLLNGPHTVLSPVAFLAGLDIVRDACQHEVIGPFVRRVMYDELLPTLLSTDNSQLSTVNSQFSILNSQLSSFADDVMERFCNPFVDHQLTSIMLNSFPKFVTRDLPALKTYFERRGTLPKGIVLGLAAICVYYRGGQRPDGTPIHPNDDSAILRLLADLWGPTPALALNGGENAAPSSLSAPSSAPSSLSSPVVGGSSADISLRVAAGVLADQDLIWHEHGDLNAIPGLTALLAEFIDKILHNGMMETVRELKD